VREKRFARGVWYQEGLCRPWRARVVVRGVRHSTGCFATEKEAHEANSRLRKELMTHSNESRHTVKGQST
jgi:hypothetical protein